MPVPGAAIAPPEAGVMVPGVMLPLPGVIVLVSVPVGAAVALVPLLAGITPDLAFCRLCSFSFSVSALPDMAPFFIMPCLPCIM